MESVVRGLHRLEAIEADISILYFLWAIISFILHIATNAGLHMYILGGLEHGARALT